MTKKKSYRGGGRTAADTATRFGTMRPRGTRQGALARRAAANPSKMPTIPTGARPIPTGATKPLRQWKGATGGKVMDKTKPN